MPYLIDGHNLIPKITGLSLRNIEDEIQLIQLLQVYHHQTGKKIEVYFDKAPPGQGRTQRFGMVTAHFVSEGSSADSAIVTRLDKLGRAANTWTVVSSDRQIQAAARSAHARVISTEKFAASLNQTGSNESHGPDADPELHLSSGEIDDWLRLFGKDQE
jgi:predicted RNA-binding protein with PIN domain